jgi:hypothetical protein
MKIKLELELGDETAIVCAALEAQITMLDEAAAIGRPTLLRAVSARILDNLEHQVEKVWPATKAWPESKNSLT